MFVYSFIFYLFIYLFIEPPKKRIPKLPYCFLCYTESDCVKYHDIACFGVSNSYLFIYLFIYHEKKQTLPACVAMRSNIDVEISVLSVNHIVLAAVREQSIQ